MSSVSLVDVVLRQQGTTPDVTRITAQTTAKAMKTALAMRAIAVPFMPVDLSIRQAKTVV